MRYEWDPAKREANLLKHGFDFLDSHLVIGDSHILVESHRGSEMRWAATGIIDGLEATVIFTRRRDTIRIISIRRARPHERKKYRELFG
jgi:uncharacterized DUF497 family protein